MSISQDQLRGLDQLRQRLSQLLTSIIALRASIDREEPLPTWPTLQSAAQGLSFNLQQLLDTFNAHAPLLRQAHAYPLTNFPGHLQEGLLQELLRKKLEPEAEKWVNSHTEEENVSGKDGLSNDDFRDLWKSAEASSRAIVGPMLEEDGAFADDFTIAEREEGVENVVTGLKRKLDGESSDDDEDMDGEDEKMVDAGPGSRGEAGTDEADRIRPLPLESMLRFMATGTLPPELQRGG